MMRTAICAAILSSLLAVATSASAECAWVLWLRTDQRLFTEASLTKGAPEVLSAYTRVQDCVTRIESQRRSEDVSVTPTQLHKFVTLDDRYMSMHFQCLPDTIDPRGPKGK